jgi:hypothetical protein
MAVAPVAASASADGISAESTASVRLAEGLLASWDLVAKDMLQSPTVSAPAPSPAAGATSLSGTDPSEVIKAAKSRAAATGELDPALALQLLSEVYARLRLASSSGSPSSIAPISLTLAAAARAGERLRELEALNADVLARIEHMEAERDELARENIALMQVRVLFWSSSNRANMTFHTGTRYNH